METSKLATLLKIGLTEGEAKVYASLLQLGPSTVGPITKTAKVSQSNTYEILDRLHKKGIATTIIKNKTKHFQAVDPVNLSKFLESKQEELDNQKNILKEALPQIQSLQSSNPTEEAQLFIGTKGLIAAYKEFLKDPEPDDENLWIYVHNEKYAEESDKFYMHTWLPTIKLLNSKGIADNSYKKSPFAKKFGKQHQLRFVDFPIFSHGEVFKDKFLLISWEKPVISVLVTAKHVSENFRKYFYEVWDKGKR
tara:strand:+ start:614 stop:1366 length:753 start_codon:yes stop_codon:yes gene_type:complete